MLIMSNTLAPGLFPCTIVLSNQSWTSKLAWPCMARMVRLVKYSFPWQMYCNHRLICITLKHVECWSVLNDFESLIKSLWFKVYSDFLAMQNKCIFIKKRSGTVDVCLGKLRNNILLLASRVTIHREKISWIIYTTNKTLSPKNLMMIMIHKWIIESFEVAYFPCKIM